MKRFWLVVLLVITLIVAFTVLLIKVKAANDRISDECMEKGGLLVDTRSGSFCLDKKALR